MSKSFIVGFVVGLALLGIIGVGASRPKQKDNKAIEEQRYQAEIATATPIQFNIMTQKQRVHSRLHNGAGMQVGGKTISEWIASYTGQRIVLGTDILGRQFIAPDHIETPEGYFGRFTQESDAVIRGKVTGKVSQITESDTFLFIVLDNVVFKAGGDGVPLYPLYAQDVLLFLKFIPETESYKLTRYNGSFELKGTFVHPFAGLFPLPPGVFNDEVSFLKIVRDAATKYSPSK